MYDKSDLLQIEYIFSHIEKLYCTSGNGKTTILHLLERFYDIQSGSVLIGSKDLRDVNLHWWRSQTAIVTQEPALFNVSIAENFAYGDLSRYVTMDEIIEAAKSATIHDFIQQLPQALT
ncbi:unnamed protein product, partial [Rotaria sp. Silwood2]